MDTPKTPGATRELSHEEYRSLRQTVQRRGNIRMILALATWSVWAALATFSWTSGLPPLVGTISLLVLVGGFELVLAMHTGVERIGRYIQHTYEPDDALPSWEHTAMAMGKHWLSPGGLDPLFSIVFLFAALTNALPTIAGGSTPEVLGTAVIHLAFVIRVALARIFVARQRAYDLNALQQVISSKPLVSKIQQER
jgi:hypothetical protein